MSIRDLTYLASEGLRAVWRGVEWLAAKYDEQLVEADDAPATYIDVKGSGGGWGGRASVFGPVAAGLVVPEGQGGGRQPWGLGVESLTPTGLPAVTARWNGEDAPVGDGAQVLPFTTLPTEPEYIGEPPTPFERALQTIIVLYNAKDCDLVDYLHQCITAWGRVGGEQ